MNSTMAVMDLTESISRELITDYLETAAQYLAQVEEHFHRATGFISVTLTAEWDSPAARLCHSRCSEFYYRCHKGEARTEAALALVRRQQAALT